MRNRNYRWTHLERAKRERRIVVGAAPESGGLQDARFRLGHRLAGTRGQNCDHP